SVDEADVGFRKTLDASIEPIFAAEEGKLLLVLSGTSQIVEGAQITACGKRALPIGSDDNTRHRRIGFPFLELSRETAHHRAGDRIERMRPIERDQPGRAAALEQQVGLRAHQLASMSLLMISRITSLVPSR